MVGDNNDITIAGKLPGARATGIKVVLVDPSAVDQELSVVVTVVSGKEVITVNLATDGTGVITSTAEEVIAAINAHYAVKDLVVASNKDADTGVGVVTAMAAVTLAGGVDGTQALAGTILVDGLDLYFCLSSDPVYGGTWGSVTLTAV
jgi:hypothetical protein